MPVSWPPTPHAGSARLWQRESAVIFLGYLSFAAAVVWLASGRRAGPWHMNRGSDRLARLLVSSLCACFAAGGAALVASERNHLALVAGSSLILGAVIYVAGLLLWRGGRAYELRAAGWLLLCAPLLIPSTLTLVLPAAGLLVITIPGNETGIGDNARV